MKRVLGILVHYINDPHRYDPLRTIALESGFHDVLVYTPLDVDFKSEKIYGFIYINGDWKQSLQPFPNITYDIGYYSESSLIQSMKKIKEHPKLPLVGYSIGNKWVIHRHLASSRHLLPYLLPTKLVNNLGMILSMVQKHSSLMVKPLNGKGGQGIFRFTKTSSGYTLTDQDGKLENHYSELEIANKLKERLRTGKFIVQKWIDIRDKQGLVYDIRVLMQKNQSGLWQMTGMGVRQGESQKITSNLTGGGQAYPVQPFLKQQFNEQVAAELCKKIEKIGWYIPTFLEKSYKRRLVELGLDLAVDRDQRIWIIEVNIKPGKTLMRKIADFEADRQVLRAPIQYAWHLLDRFKK